MADETPEADAPLVDVAGAVADRTPVDWEREQVRTPERRPVLARLQEIAALQAALTSAREAVPSGVLFTWGTLQALERIGEGSFAEIHRAWDPTLQREVALKLRRADLGVPSFGTSRWIEEARRLARVRHPHVLSILGADEHEGRAGLWTELIDGSTLEQWITSQGPLGPREAAGVGADLCSALAAVHATGLLHGDVTTRNVMREGGSASGSASRSGRIVLMDFGSAQDARVTDLIAYGTPLFMAPEVLAGEAPDVRSDVYSLGIVLYRLLTARYPIEPGSIDEMRGRLERGERVSLRDARTDLPAAMVEVVERACDPDRARRFATMAEFERSLARAIAAPEAVDADEVVGAGRRSRLTLAGLAAAAIVVVALLATRAGRESNVGAPPATVLSDDVIASEASPTSTPATPAVATAGAPEVAAALLRVTAGSREVLRSGDLVAPGDELALELDSREIVHVYVLSEDETGAVFVLFPLSGRGSGNPLAAATPHRLPGRDGAGQLTWQVTSAGGRETFLLLASRKPLAPVAEAVAAIPEAAADAPVAYRTLPADALARLRGVGGVRKSASLQQSDRTGILSALARDLATSSEGRAVWMRLLVLENPVP